jgi:hypothetical protein
MGCGDSKPADAAGLNFDNVAATPAGPDAEGGQGSAVLLQSQSSSTNHVEVDAAGGVPAADGAAGFEAHAATLHDILVRLEQQTGIAPGSAPAKAVSKPAAATILIELESMVRRIEAAVEARMRRPE